MDDRDYDRMCASVQSVIERHFPWPVGSSCEDRCAEILASFNTKEYLDSLTTDILIAEVAKKMSEGSSANPDISSAEESAQRLARIQSEMYALHFEDLRPDFEARSLVMKATDPTGGFNRWSNVNEQKTLKELRSALTKAQRAWHRLHLDIQDAILEEAYDGTFKRRRVPGVPDASPSSAALALPGIAELLEPSIVAARRCIKRDGLPKGGTYWPEVAAIGSCRAIWWWRKDKKAPSGGFNSDTPFGRFVSDIFETCELRKPHSAFDAWVRVQSSSPTFDNPLHELF